MAREYAFTFNGIICRNRLFCANRTIIDAPTGSSWTTNDYSFGVYKRWVFNLLLDKAEGNHLVLLLLRLSSYYFNDRASEGALQIVRLRTSKTIDTKRK